MTEPDIVAWGTNGDGPRVLVRERAGRVSIVLQDRRGRYLSVSPGDACQLASGIDEALTKIVRRDGQIVRPA